MASSINPRMTGEELRQSWQGRALYWARGQMAAALLSLIADNYDDTMPFLLAAVFDGCAGIATPFYCSNPKIDKRGHIVADMIGKWGQKIRDSVIFTSEKQMEGVFRRLADTLRFDDAERVDLFECVRHWVKADMRLDPTMDSRDPDARRLVLN